MFIPCSCQSFLRLSPSSLVKSQFELIRSFSNPNCWLLFHQFCCFKSAFPLLHSMTPNSEHASSPTEAALSALRWTLRKASIRRWWPLSPCWPFPQWSVSWRPWLARCNTRGWKSNWDNNGMMGIGSYHFQSWFQMVKKQSFSDDVLEFDWICARDDPEWWFRFNWWVKARGPGLGRLFPNHCCWPGKHTRIRGLRMNNSRSGRQWKRVAVDIMRWSTFGPGCHHQYWCFLNPIQAIPNSLVFWDVFWVNLG